jgi:hypothetical protein
MRFAHLKRILKLGRLAITGLMHRSKGPKLFDHPVCAAEGMDRTIAGDGRCSNRLECRNVFPPRCKFSHRGQATEREERHD